MKYVNVWRLLLEHIYFFPHCVLLFRLFRLLQRDFIQQASSSHSHPVGGRNALCIRGRKKSAQKTRSSASQRASARLNETPPWCLCWAAGCISKPPDRSFAARTYNRIVSVSAALPPNIVRPVFLMMQFPDLLICLLRCIFHQASVRDAFILSPPVAIKGINDALVSRLKRPLLN